MNHPVSARPTPTREHAATLLRVQRLFDAASVSEHEAVLAAVQQPTPKSHREAIRLHDALLFSVAYAPSATIRALAETALRAVCGWIADHAERHGDAAVNSGAPGNDVIAEFSLPLTTWLHAQHGERIGIEDGNEMSDHLMQVLHDGLDPVEQEMMHAGKQVWPVWRDALAGTDAPPSHVLTRLLDLANSMPTTPALADQLWAGWRVVTRWNTRAKDLLQATARPPLATVGYHDDGLLRRVTIDQALAQGPAREIRCTQARKQELCAIAKTVLAGMQRETDPVTLADESATALFDMGRGLCIALYFMRPERKMSLQSYVGYMAFKNRVPIAYGGGWVMGAESGFGVNIFPPFRGGESANIVVQLLRLYAHEFSVRSFTVDPYQIGAGNPDGITSASFWFYYRLGFRPMQPDLAALAEREFALLQQPGQPRTARQTLRKLAHASMRWTDPSAGAFRAIPAERMADVVSNAVHANALGDRRTAMRSALRKIARRAAMRCTPAHPIARIAVLLDACGYVDKATPAQLRSFVNDYAIKFVDERAFCRRAHRHAAFYDCLYHAEQALPL